MSSGTNSKSLESTIISDKVKELWKEASDIGIKFNIHDKSNMLLKTDFNNMRVEQQTYIDVERTKAHYDARIKECRDELLKLVLFRDRLKQLLEIIDEYEIDETNLDLLKECAMKLNGKLTS